MDPLKMYFLLKMGILYSIVMWVYQTCFGFKDHSHQHVGRNPRVKPTTPNRCTASGKWTTVTRRFRPSAALSPLQRVLTWGARRVPTWGAEWDDVWGAYTHTMDLKVQTAPELEEPGRNKEDFQEAIEIDGWLLFEMLGCSWFAKFGRLKIS